MRIRLLILCVALLLALSGCSGAIELQETGIVMGIGIDASEDGESVEITVEIANYTEDSSKSADSPQDNIFTSKGRTITDAINNLKSTVDKYLFWGHNKVIIFGEKILQAGINAHIDACIRNAEMRPTAFILAVIATLGACGASGVAGGSLLLIPLACSLFGISNDIAMQAVAVGFIIGVVQDSLETAINSSGDVMFAATAEFMDWQKEGKELPF